mmetsp:Transcript_10857/g.29979  ORF Transcript_10857/g.29979 Transcript_10857/m.29979 type:complete len:208 (-) Transcript_10857:341-964(-)
MLRTVSIMPGMEMAAPLLQENKSGFPDLVPYSLPVSASTWRTDSRMAVQTDAGRSLPRPSKFWQSWVVRVNPGGTWAPILVISCSPKPLPPRMVLSGLSTGVALPPKGTMQASTCSGVMMVVIVALLIAVAVSFVPSSSSLLLKSAEGFASVDFMGAEKRDEEVAEVGQVEDASGAVVIFPPNANDEETMGGGNEKVAASLVRVPMF